MGYKVTLEVDLDDAETEEEARESFWELVKSGWYDGEEDVEELED